MTDLTALADMLGKATGPDDEVDYILHGIANGWRLPSDPHLFSWRTPGHYQYGDPGDYRSAIYIEEDALPPVTASVDAALGLTVQMLPEWGIQVTTEFHLPGCVVCRLAPPRASDWSSSLVVSAVGPTRPIAILRALVAALPARPSDECPECYGLGQNLKRPGDVGNWNTCTACGRPQEGLRRSCGLLVQRARPVRPRRPSAWLRGAVVRSSGHHRSHAGSRDRRR